MVALPRWHGTSASQQTASVGVDSRQMATAVSGKTLTTLGMAVLGSSFCAEAVTTKDQATWQDGWALRQSQGARASSEGAHAFGRSEITKKSSPARDRRGERGACGCGSLPATVSPDRVNHVASQRHPNYRPLASLPHELQRTTVPPQVRAWVHPRGRRRSLPRTASVRRIFDGSSSARSLGRKVNGLAPLRLARVPGR